MEDANEWGQQERRRASFVKWLLKAWEWAEETGRPVAADIAELLSRADEPDYPLWEMARRKGIIGDTPLFDKLRKQFGIPVSGPKAVGWEREINFCPVIRLEEKVWRDIHGSLGWVNRYPDKRVEEPSFYLWSEAGNYVVFLMRKDTTNASI